MEAEAAKAIGSGIACLGMGGAGIGLGTIFGNYLAGALRNPSAAASQTATLFIGMAFAEALGIFSFLVALLLLFGALKPYEPVKAASAASVVNPVSIVTVEQSAAAVR